ncbi:MAG: nucleoside-diphosphate-sugar epimerase [Candidatus Paceibacteria bacterium]
MKALVTGGGGFLGTAICRQLREAGHEVHSYSRQSYAHLEALGVHCIRGQLGDGAALESAVQGRDTVFHVAAKAGVWGSRKAYHEANVLGTQNVIRACLKAGTSRLIHTSSPSVCFDGTDHRNADNTLPLATRFLAVYPQTKAQAERDVLEANGVQLATCALRPHLIFGPGDPHLLPRLVQMGRAGKLAQVGDGRNEVTMCFVENAAHAHLLAANSLSPTAPHAGKAYFIGQEDPVQLWDWIGQLFEQLQVPAIKKRVTRRTAYSMGVVLEIAWRMLPLSGEPPMTRFVATQLASSHSYSMAPAHADFGYRELFNMQEATRLTLRWLREST